MFHKYKRNVLISGVSNYYTEFKIRFAIFKTRDSMAVQFCTKPGGNVYTWFEYNCLFIPSKVIKPDRSTPVPSSTRYRHSAFCGPGYVIQRI